MLHTESPHQGFYAPLSQLMTDSDSEEEIHNLSKHRKQQQQQQQIKRLARNPPNTLDIQQPHIQYQQQLELDHHQQRHRQLVQQQQKQKHYHHQQQHHHKLQSNSERGNNQHQPSSYTTNMQNTFRSVMMSDSGMVNGEAGSQSCVGSNFSSFNSDYDERQHTDADNVAILGGSSNDASKDATNEPMSPTRRVCFIASLLLCVFAVCGFVWIVPCEPDGKTCPAPLDRLKTHNWFNNYTRLELKGGVNVVNGLRSWENNLIFLYRGDVFFPEFESSKTKRNGIICLIGSSGAVAWFDEMVDEPVAIDCTLLDVDRNGKTDCLVIDEYGELGAINPLSGQWYWKFRERSTQKLVSGDFPIMLPDLDGDGTLDILIGTSESLEQKTRNILRQYEFKNKTFARNVNERNYLRILSGHSGRPIGEGYRLHNCDYLRKFQLENSDKITFNCLHNNTQVQLSKTLAELFALITNKSIVSHKLLPISKIAQHRHYRQRKDIDAQRNIYSLSGRELVVENRGKCPEDCNVTLILSETRDGHVNIIKNFTTVDMYGMVPAQWHFKNRKSNLSGFVMKFWKWNKPAKQEKKTKNHTTKFSENMVAPDQGNHFGKRSTEHEFPLGDFDAFDHLVQKRQTYTIDATGRGDRTERRTANMTTDHQRHDNKDYKMQMITETVILVIFIGADTRIENTSQSSIIQFCRSERNEVVCQPDLNNQENSMLIADLDQDGSQELVSYVSMFESENEANPSNWKLVTYVRLLRLQSELSEFYDETKHH